MTFVFTNVIDLCIHQLVWISVWNVSPEIITILLNMTLLLNICSCLILNHMLKTLLYVLIVIGHSHRSTRKALYGPIVEVKHRVKIRAR